MDYYDEIKNELVNNEINKRVKNYSINRNELNAYYNIGKILKKAEKRYGDGIVKEYSKRLSMDLGRGYSKRNLWLMLKFYELKEKVQTLSAQLSWSHYCELLSINDVEEINYYISITEENNLSVRQLRNRIRSNEYKRIPTSTKERNRNKKQLEIVNLIKNPICIKSNKEYDIVSEKILQKLIKEDIEHFLEELGSGFTFIKSEYKIKIGTNYNYIDLLLFNIKYNCYVVVELKVTKLKKEHIGQIQVYMNYIDENIKSSIHEKTIGIIICREDNGFIIRYCSDDRIIAREYIIVQ